jgi:hypothetical protein
MVKYHLLLENTKPEEYFNSSELMNLLLDLRNKMKNLMITEYYFNNIFQILYIKACVIAYKLKFL